MCQTCNISYKNKHSSQCHVPNFKGPDADQDNGLPCAICRQVFKTQRGLSQHERFFHTSERNRKREEAATDKRNHGPSKGYGKTWNKEVDTMIRLEKSLQGHRRIAQQMMEHLPGKTATQIRDKCHEPTYKAFVETYMATHGHPVTQRPTEDAGSSTGAGIETTEAADHTAELTTASKPRSTREIYPALTADAQLAPLQPRKQKPRAEVSWIGEQLNENRERPR